MTKTVVIDLNLYKNLLAKYRAQLQMAANRDMSSFPLQANEAYVHVPRAELLEMMRFAAEGLELHIAVEEALARPGCDNPDCVSCSSKGENKCH